MIVAENLTPDPMRLAGVRITPLREADATAQRLAHKASGHDDHELMVVRAGDIRALLTTIESLRPPPKWIVNYDGADLDGRFAQIVAGPGHELEFTGAGDR